MNTIPGPLDRGVSEHRNNTWRESGIIEVFTIPLDHEYADNPAYFVSQVSAIGGIFSPFTNEGLDNLQKVLTYIYEHEPRLMLNMPSSPFTSTDKDLFRSESHLRIMTKSVCISTVQIGDSFRADLEKIFADDIFFNPFPPFLIDDQVKMTTRKGAKDYGGIEPRPMMMKIGNIGLSHRSISIVYAAAYQ